jgi:hypothetical protein
MRKNFLLLLLLYIQLIGGLGSDNADANLDSNMDRCTFVLDESATREPIWRGITSPLADRGQVVRLTTDFAVAVEGEWARSTPDDITKSPGGVDLRWTSNFLDKLEFYTGWPMTLLHALCHCVGRPMETGPDGVQDVRKFGR